MIYKQNFDFRQASYHEFKGTSTKINERDMNIVIQIKI